MRSFSQLQQDIEVLKYYDYKHNGYFVEIGASDGIELSNTYLLETEYNWKGICVEPIPERYDLLLTNRPKSICSNKAIYNKSNLSLLFDISNECDLFSGLSAYIDCHKHIVEKDKKQINVSTISLNDLLDESNCPQFIDYLSLDTEGSELEILQSVDFDKYKFGIIDVEHNYIEPRRSEIYHLLLSKGYKYKGENQWDDSFYFKLDNIE